MKKLSFILMLCIILTSFSMFTTAAAPKVGDQIGDVLYSDITAYINGLAIPTSVIQGKTLVVVEDLANYGFDVTWNNNDRSLKVEFNKNDKKLTPIEVKKTPYINPELLNKNIFIPILKHTYLAN